MKLQLRPLLSYFLHHCLALLTSVMESKLTKVLIHKYPGYDYLAEEMFEVNRTALNQNSFKVKVQIKGMTNILLLNVPYIAIDPSFPHHINSFDNVPANYSAGNLTNISASSTSMRRYTNTINYSQQATGRYYTSFKSPWSRNKILLFMTSLFLFGTN